MIKVEANLPPLTTEERLEIALELLREVYDTQMCMNLWVKIGEFTGQRETEE